MKYNENPRERKIRDSLFGDFNPDRKTQRKSPTSTI